MKRLTVWIAAGVFGVLIVYWKRSEMADAAVVLAYTTMFTVFLSPVCAAMERRGMRATRAASCAVIGLAYSVYSYSSLYRHAGLFHIDVIVNPVNAPVVYNKLEEILKDFSSKTITKAEWDSLYTQLRIEMIMGSESARNRMERNAKALLMHNRVVTLEETLEKLSKVSAEDIRMFGEQYFDLSKAGICLVGDISKEAEKVKKKWC